MLKNRKCKCEKLASFQQSVMDLLLYVKIEKYKFVNLRVSLASHKRLCAESTRGSDVNNDFDQRTMT